MTIYLSILGVLTFVAWAGTIRQIIREPRRTGHGLLLLGCLFLTWLFAVSMAAKVSDRAAIRDVVYFGPPFLAVLGVIAAAVFLFVNTGSVVRREGFRLVTLVPAAIATALLAGLAGCFALFALVAGELAPDWSIFLLSVVLPFVVLPLLMIIVELGGYTLYALYYGRLGLSRDAEAVVVLGAGLSGDKVTPLLASRIDRGIEVFRRLRADGSDPLFVVSGGQGADEVISEAEAMSRYAADAGVPEDRIVREDTSTTTEENLRNTVAILHARGIASSSLAVVTSNFHVLRAASLTRRIGVPAQVIGAHTAAYYLPAGFLREFVATLVHYRKWNTVVWTTITLIIWLFVALLWFLGAQQTEVVDFD